MGYREAHGRDPGENGSAAPDARREAALCEDGGRNHERPPPRTDAHGSASRGQAGGGAVPTPADAKPGRKASAWRDTARMILDASVYGVVVLIALLSACKDQCGEAGSATGNPVFLAGVFVNVVPVLLYNARQGSIEYFRGLVPVLFPAIGNSFTLAILFLGLGDTAQPAHGILALIPVATAAYQIFVLCRCDRHGFALKRGAIAANLAAAAILSAVIIAGAIGLDIRPYALTTGIALQIIGAMQ